MKTNTSVLLISFGLLLQPLDAGSRTSASYSITADTSSSGGAMTASASYSNNASTGGVAGVSAATSPAETLKSGFIAQLADVTALQLATAPLTINETGTRQLSATQLLDDATTNNLLASSVNWSVLSGPISGISVGGLATAATVYQDTASQVQGSFAGLSGTLTLTVLDTIKDNFGSYAGDGIGDDWQVQYFGLNNPDAAPMLDPDHDGFTNQFEFAAGLDPTSTLSVFNCRIEAVPGQPAHKQIVFSPIVAGRTYTVKAAATLGVPMTPLPIPIIVGDNGNERTVIDTNATGGAKFYSVEIVKP